MGAILLVVSAILAIVIVNWLYGVAMRVMGVNVMSVNMSWKAGLMILAFLLIYGTLNKLF